VAAFLDDLQSLPSLVAVELRPPRAELESGAGMDAWIDLHHSVRALARQDIRVMLTDSAVGAQEENNLRHLVANLGDAVPRSRIVPFLTTKHSLEYCLTYADQAVEHGFPALVILGGDKHVGRPRIVEHAWQLRALLRERHPQLQLGGWANPVANPVAQVRFLRDPQAHADFFLTQIVSHHQQAEVDAFLNEAARTGLTMPGVFGVFYYRSANERTLQTLSRCPSRPSRASLPQAPPRPPSAPAPSARCASRAHGTSTSATSPSAVRCGCCSPSSTRSRLPPWVSRSIPFRSLPSSASAT
jgi:hypothetical protein